VELKRLEDGDLMKAWGGVSGLGLGLSLLWTEGRRRGIGARKIVEWVSGAAARHVGLDGRKGEIREGLDGDLVVFDPEAEFAVSAFLSQSFLLNFRMMI
jgi:allantoinase